MRLTVTNPLPDGGPGAACRPRVARLAASAGIGALRTADTGYGLTGMRERLLLLRGTLEAGQRDGQSVVIADFPLTPATATAAGAPGDAGPVTTRPPVAAPVTREGSC